jgi:hypothetical protein
LKAVRPYTIKGKILCSVIEFLCFTFSLFKGKKWRLPRSFEENPRTMSLSDIIYFAYKYYYHPPLLPATKNIATHFQKQPGKEVIFETLATVSIGGDLMPYELIKPENTLHLWDEAGPDFFGSDIVFANLETPLDTGRKPEFVPEVMLNHMLFNTDETTFGVFSGQGKYKGYDVLSVANNHSLDMGADGLINTLDNLRHKGIQTVGAKKEEVEDDFQIVEVNGIKIGFVAYTYSLNEFLPEKGREWMVNYLPLNCEGCDIATIKGHVEACRKAGAELIVCSMHCGNAYQAYPSTWTIRLFEQVFEATGVDVIAGGHPHNLQPWQNYQFTDPFSGKAKTGFAIYSLADFIAYDIFTWCHLCAYVKLEIGRDEAGAVVFRAIVKPLFMQRENGQLKLVVAADVFSGQDLSREQEDIKYLYDICMLQN